jgi:hypothetical protein
VSCRVGQSCAPAEPASASVPTSNAAIRIVRR